VNWRSVNIAVEGDSDVEVARAVVRAAGLEPAATVYGLRGKDHLDAKLAAYSRAAVHQPWLVLRDLDRAPCAGQLVASLAPLRPPMLCLRVAVPSMEAWLLADRERIASFLHVSRDLVPASPETLSSPKRALVDLARRARKRDVVGDLVPRPGSTARVGPNYTARVSEFARDVWRPRVAAKTSASLARCLSALSQLPKH
jgi:hypothetical protein